MHTFAPAIGQEREGVQLLRRCWHIYSPQDRKDEKKDVGVGEDNDRVEIKIDIYF